MLIVHCVNSVMCVNLRRFMFGDGGWDVTVTGENLFA